MLLKQDFTTVFLICSDGGYRGINVTYQHKKSGEPLVMVDGPLIGGIGAVNTVIFTADGPRSTTPGSSGFFATYARLHGTADPGAALHDRGEMV